MTMKKKRESKIPSIFFSIRLLYCCALFSFFLFQFRCCCYRLVSCEFVAAKGMLYTPYFTNYIYTKWTDSIYFWECLKSVWIHYLDEFGIVFFFFLFRYVGEKQFNNASQKVAHNSSFTSKQFNINHIYTSKYSSFSIHDFLNLFTWITWAYFSYIVFFSHTIVFWGRWIPLFVDIA